MSICEPGQDRNVAALSYLFMCGGFSSMDKHELFMLEAIKEAKIAFKENEIPVGCVITYEDKIIARGYNLREKSKDISNHAEIIAIKEAERKLNDWQLNNCNIYVTMEPCIMCAGAIYQARIKNVYYGVNNLSGGGFGGIIDINEAKINHHPNVYPGVLKDECKTIIDKYFALKR